MTNTVKEREQKPDRKDKKAAAYFQEKLEFSETDFFFFSVQNENKSYEGIQE